MAKRAAKPKTPPRPRKPAEALAPDTRPADAPGGVRVMYVPRQPSGVRVTEDTALTYAAVWACHQVISQTMACMSWHVFRRRDAGGKDPAPGHAVDWLLHVQANDETPAFAFREAIVGHVLGWGNGYAEVERDAMGRPAWLHLLTPDRVQPARDARGRLVYDVWNYGGPNTALDAADVFHVKGYGFDGLVGYPVLRYAAQSVGIGMAADQFTAAAIGNDATPGGVLEHPKTLTDEARKYLRESFEEKHRGPRNARRLAILEEGMKWAATSLSPEAMQFVELQYLKIEDICRVYRVPPHKIQHLLRSTFSNIEHQSIEFVTDTVLPWARRLESEADIKLFGRQQRGTYFTKLNLNSLLRGDATSRANYYKTMAGLGVYSVNEIRELEDQNPIGPDGDKRLVPMNMTTLERIGTDPPAPAPDVPAEPAADPAPPDEGPTDGPPTDGPDQPGGGLPQELALLADACGRALRREMHRTADAVRRLGASPARLDDWRTAFAAEHAGYLRRTLGPALEGHGPADPAAAAALLELAVREHLADLDRRVRDVQGVGKVDGWDGAAAGWARRLAGQAAVAAAVATGTKAG